MARIKTGTANIIKRNSDNVVFVAYANTDNISLNSTNITVTNSSGVEFEKWSEGVGYTSSTTTKYENVTLPSGYAPSKFIYDGSSWTQHSDWVDNPGLYFSKLLTDIDDSTTSIVVDPMCDMLVEDAVLQIGSEKITFKSFTKNEAYTQHTMTVTRASDSTTAASHKAGVIIYHNLFT